MVEAMNGKWCSCIFVVLLTTVVTLEAAEHIHIRTIKIEGNRKTKEALILRELHLKLGDSVVITKLTDRLEYNQTLLMNTGLFNDVEINIKAWDQEEQDVDLSVKVVESWYIFPLPIFELADRNLNVWWTEHNASLKRPF